MIRKVSLMLLFALSQQVMAEDAPAFTDIKAKYHAFAEFTKGLESRPLKWSGIVLESKPRVFGGQYLIIDMDSDNREDLHLLFGEDRETEIKAYQHGDQVEFESKLPMMSATAFDNLLIKLDNPTIEKTAEGKKAEASTSTEAKKTDITQQEEKPIVEEVKDSELKKTEVASPDTTPTDDKKVLDVSKNQFEERFRELLKDVKTPLKLSKGKTSEGAPGLTLTQYNFGSENISLMLETTAKKEVTSAVVLAGGSEDNPMKAVSNLLMAMAATVAAVDPSLSKDTRGSLIMEELKVPEIRLGESSEVDKNGIHYSYQAVPNMGFMFTVSPVKD